MGTGANYSKFVVDNSATMGEGRTDTPLGKDPSKGQEFGQIKYTPKGTKDTIYDDDTRDTDNDTRAQLKGDVEAGDNLGEAEGDGAGKGGKD